MPGLQEPPGRSVASIRISTTSVRTWHRSAGPQGGVGDRPADQLLGIHPRAARDQSVEHGFEADPVGDPWSMAPQRVGLVRDGVRGSTAAQTVATTSGSSARMMSVTSTRSLVGTHPESNLGLHNDRWMVTYPHGL